VGRDLGRGAPLRGRAVELVRRARAAAALARRHRAIARAASAPRSAPRVSYGHEHIPGPDELAFGGLVKFQGLQPRFPNAPRDFNLLYLGSSSLPPDAVKLIELARSRGAPVVWNQNGVAYPAWAGADTDRINAPRSAGLHAAAHVLYQSAYCKLSSDAALGEPSCPWEVLHNPVDTQRFRPASGAPNGLVVLLGGNQYERYRLETALRSFAVVAAGRPDARLLVTGSLSWSYDRDANLAETLGLAARLGVADRIDFLGSYSQAEAPEVLRRAHLLLHTKVNDPCPTIVLEAMACGLPVVYSASGGVPELVGDAAGIGIETPVRWDEIDPPAPELFGAAVLEASERLPELGEAARARAVERFDVRPWIERHTELFEELLGGR
jgi:glycosyltransferase involved in cell wall biosynthesis